MKVEVVLVIVVVCSTSLSGCSSISREGLSLLAFKDAIFDDPSSALSNWNPLDQNPCNWSGVLCLTSGGSVQALNLPGLSLKGFLAPELGLLTYLETLNLRSNSILGAIPRQLGGLKNLENLDLSLNQLTGVIPKEIGNLSNIAKIFLEGNDLVGSIPPELGKLEKLQELHLHRNRFQGTILGDNESMNINPNPQGLYGIQGRKSSLCNLKQLKDANFSHNFLVGRIPTCLKYLPRSSFDWNCLQDGDPNLHQRPLDQCGFLISATKPTNQPKLGKENGNFKPLWLLPLEIVMGSFIAAIFLVAAVMTLIKYKKEAIAFMPWKKTLTGHEGDRFGTGFGALNGVTVMSRVELQEACEDFSNIIGCCPDSIVYKGITSQGREIAVTSMRVTREDWTPQSEVCFRKKVQDLAKLNHRNIVKLLGHCTENEPFTRMFVFEYASNGTLYEHLHYGDGWQLGWSARMKIIAGVAHGLQYMHHELVPPVSFVDLDSNAIYLTEDFTPKLADFETWKSIFVKDERRSIFKSSATLTRGSVESLGDHSDIEFNIFSFGVLLLEIISGRFPYCKHQGSLLDWAQEYLEVPEVIAYLVDPALRYFRYSDLQTVCEVVRLCIKSDHTRPSMKQIVCMLESGIDTSETAGFKESPLKWAEHQLVS
ncbi:probable LRR receptor-like serine/threonine-protein kinase At1g63430 isoform X2 [Cryptomeria japonica]|uniref:probable LRR receptor-like serine/threonine-protein kinase At1g63430 isoform X2 n=1 Tax=Cryptomeria japonica TaxID=3369 RepID=UPI0025AC89BE|nr:probable LRR receptor-like serine/threonine-protein kinase At1g63430 isoform X2 [Cryptomeria japonica]